MSGEVLRGIIDLFAKIIDKEKHTCVRCMLGVFKNELVF
jgi:hypothetical protein